MLVPVSGLFASSSRDDVGAAVSRKIINGEPCELVTHFEQLSEGMIVYTGPCPYHSTFHRVMLIDKQTQLVMGGLIDESDGVMESFEMVPSPPFPHGPADAVTPGFVAAGHVWRVVDETPLYQRTVRARVAVKT